MYDIDKNTYKNECLAISLKTVLKDGVFIMICFLLVSSESLLSCAVTGFFFLWKFYRFYIFLRVFFQDILYKKTDNGRGREFLKFVMIAAHKNRNLVFVVDGVFPLLNLSFFCVIFFSLFSSTFQLCIVCSFAVLCCELLCVSVCLNLFEFFELSSEEWRDLDFF